MGVLSWIDWGLGLWLFVVGCLFGLFVCFDCCFVFDVGCGCCSWFACGAFDLFLVMWVVGCLLV